MKTIRKTNLLIFSVLFVILISTSAGLQSSLSIPSSGMISSPTPSPLGWLHTEGNKIKDSKGQSIRLMGGAVSILEWGWDNPNGYMHGNWNEGYVRFFKEAGGNSLRLALSCYPLDESYFALVDQFVGWCKKHGVYVILDMHFGDPDDVDAGRWAEYALKIIENPTAPINRVLTSDYPSISWVDWLIFYANRYKDEPTVCGICIFNEPCQQQTGANYLFGVWRNAANLAINGIQSVNPNILCFVYGMEWGGTLRYWNSDPLPQKNVVYGITRHMQFDSDQPYYINYVNGDYEAGKQAFEDLWINNKIFEMASKYPVDFIEWGSGNEPYDAGKEHGYIRWTADTLDILDEHGLNGQHYWIYSGYGPNDCDLLRHQDWVNSMLSLSERGEIWQQHL